MSKEELTTGILSDGFSLTEMFSKTSLSQTLKEALALTADGCGISTVCSGSNYELIDWDCTKDN